jgi:two-component system chemotaxis sensor kinase CheA
MEKPSIREMFFEEAEELLEALTEGLAELENDIQNIDIVNAVFRAVHSIKGGAGAFALDDLVDFAHKFETVMDQIRDQSLSIDPELMRILHKSGDQLCDLVEAARDDTPFDKDARNNNLRELEPYLQNISDEEIQFDSFPLSFDAAPIQDFELISIDDNENIHDDINSFHIKIEANNSLYKLGHEPLYLFDQLSKLGEVDIRLEQSSIPKFSELDKGPYLSWEVYVSTSHKKEEVQSIFEFVEDLCHVQISNKDNAHMAGFTSEILEKSDKPEKSKINLSESEVPKSNSTQPKNNAAEVKKQKATVRVDLERVDRLINNVGELIINQAMINQCVEKLQLPPTSQIMNEIEEYKLLARDIQEGVMAIRAQPVKPLFQRMGRIVREAAEATGKQAKLVTYGEATEVDKTFIERLADPLTHMIRNAIDHGLEDDICRHNSGKTPVGTIHLSATHRSGNVILEVSDDGAGINRQKVKEKAIAKGLISRDAELTDNEIDNLLFLPGFSTASQVSSLSGRGVGMDVVKNAVQQLGGRISVTSQIGKGSTFSIVLPLTLAVMDGFVISVADQTMVVPISSIIETVSAGKDNIHTIGQQDRLLFLRGRYIPIIDIATSLQLDDNNHQDIKNYLIVKNETCGICALEIKEIHDQRQIVVKNLETQYCTIPEISAATILGDGKIALILDTDEITRRNFS